MYMYALIHKWLPEFSPNLLLQCIDRKNMLDLTEIDNKSEHAYKIFTNFIVEYNKMKLFPET